jgi:hypothetical protein
MEELMFFKPTFAPHCTIYVDETGSFSDQGQTFNGLCAIVARNDPAVRAAISEAFNRVERVATDAERRDGEVKGSRLLQERYPLVVPAFQDHGVVVCHHTFRVNTAGELNGFDGVVKLLLPYINTALVDQPAYERERRSLLEAFEKAGNVDRHYAFCVWAFFRKVVASLFNGIPLPDTIAVVFDPKLRDRYAPMLAFAVRHAFMEAFRPYITGTRPAVFSNDVYPWRVRDFDPGDEHPLALADWLAYPLTALVRMDFTEAEKMPYMSIPPLFVNRLFYMPKDAPRERRNGRELFPPK